VRSILVWLIAVGMACMLTAGCSPSREPIKLYAMGERAEAGFLVYNVLEAVWRDSLGEDANLRVPQHRFLLLRLSITNGGPQEASIPLTTLVSSEGKEFPESTNGEGVENWLGIVRHIKATETVFGWILFDAPRGDYQLRVSDDAFDPADAKLALIQIPLRLESKSDFLPDAGQRR